MDENTTQAIVVVKGQHPTINQRKDMPINEFSKSMKAKMYDFTYTPFMSSMVIAWIILNHK